MEGDRRPAERDRHAGADADAGGPGDGYEPGVPRVFVLTDVRLYAEGLVNILEREPSIDVIGTSSSPREAMDSVFDRSVEVILVDLQAPAGPQVARMIRDAAPDVWLVALAVPEGDEDIVAWAEAGIAGVLPRDGSFRDLVAMIHSVVHGETVCSPRAAAALLRRVAVLARAAGPSPAAERAGIAADVARDRRRPAHGSRALEQGDRGFARHRPADREEPHPPRAREAPGPDQVGGRRCRSPESGDQAGHGSAVLVPAPPT